MEQVKELLESTKDDLGIVERLSVTMKDNQYFSHSLDGQVDVIINKVMSASRNLNVIAHVLNEYFKEQEANIPYKEVAAPEKEIAPIGLTVLDAETLAVLEQFKDK